MFDIRPELVAVFIPILIVIGVFAVVMIAVVVEGRQKELRHKERILAMEKGIELPEEPKKEKRPVYRNLRAWGLALFSLGVVLCLAIGFQVGFRYSLWGLLPAAVGAAMLVAAAYEKREESKL
jgi:hypothetical protein